MVRRLPLRSMECSFGQRQRLAKAFPPGPDPEEADSLKESRRRAPNVWLEIRIKNADRRFARGPVGAASFNKTNINER
jgi:hypothetical protein